MAEIGLIKPSEIEVHDGMTFPDRAGVYYAKAMDMDNNGIDELYHIEMR